MLVKCIESFTLLNTADFVEFAKDEEYIFEIQRGYLIYNIKNGGLYEISIADLKKYFTQVIF